MNQDDEAADLLRSLVLFADAAPTLDWTMMRNLLWAGALAARAERWLTARREPDRDGPLVSEVPSANGEKPTART